MYSSGNVYRVRGGDSAQLFTVHAALVLHYSPSFGDLYEEVRIEGEDRGRPPGAIRYDEDGSVHLRDVKAETLEVAMTWVYDQELYKRAMEGPKPERKADEQQARGTTLPSHKGASGTTSSTALSEERSTDIASPPIEPREDTPLLGIAPATLKKVSIETYEELVDLYIFAETYEFSQLKIEIVRQWQGLSRKGVHCLSNVVRKAYDHLPDGSKLIDLIAYDHAFWIREDATSAEAAGERMPDRVWKHVTKWIMKTEPTKDRHALRANACLFHHHASHVEEASCAAAFKDYEEEVKWHKRKRQLEHHLEEHTKRIRLHSESFHQIAKSTKGANIHKLKVDGDGMMLSSKLV